MIGLMNTPPEQLYRPDVSITAWRKYCQESARGAASVPDAGLDGAPRTGRRGAARTSAAARVTQTPPALA